MNKILSIITISFLVSCASQKKIKPNLGLGSTNNSSLIETAQSSLMKTTAIITELASDKNAGRQPGTPGFENVVKYTEDFLKESNIKPYFKGTYKDSVMIKGKQSYNVVGLIGDQKNGKPYIILGAHLDHLGIKKSPTDSIYNGANDNASGVTSVLRVAEALAKQNLKKNIIVALFTGEESGLLGSKHLAKKLKNEGIDLAYMLNFEMLGTILTTGPGQVYLTGYEMSNFADELNKAVDKDFVKFLPEEIQYKLFYRSDNYAFYQEFGIPCQTISTFDFKNYDYYHKAKDEVSELDLDNMEVIIKKSIQAVYSLIENDVVLKMKK